VIVKAGPVFLHEIVTSKQVKTELLKRTDFAEYEQVIIGEIHLKLTAWLAVQMA